MGGPELERLIQLFAKLPGLGPRSARRIVLKLLRERETKLLPLADAIREAAETVRSCSVCGNLDSAIPAPSAQTPRARKKSAWWKPWRISGRWSARSIYRGTYHVLGGSLSALAGRGPEDIAIAPLLERLQADPPTEVILAMPATVDGAATGHYLAEKLKPLGIPVSRLAQGVPMGGALEVLDEGTLATALRARSLA